MAPLIKICGSTSPADARLAVESGTDFVGVVLHPPSPRFIHPEAVEGVREAIGDAKLVLVTVNLSREVLLDLWTRLRPYAVQLHGDESLELVRELFAAQVRVWKVLPSGAESLLENAEAFTQAGAEAVVIDAREVTSEGIIYGGTGHVADWNLARRLVEDGYRVILAGGLTPDNVARAVETVQPWAVDVASGVEARKGVKDAEKVQAFVDYAKQTDTAIKC